MFAGASKRRTLNVEPGWLGKARLSAGAKATADGRCGMENPSPDFSQGTVGSPFLLYLETKAPKGVKAPKSRAAKRSAGCARNRVAEHHHRIVQLSILEIRCRSEPEDVAAGVAEDSVVSEVGGEI